MRKFKKIALLCALLMIATIGTTAGANAGERSVAQTAVSAEGTESIADTNLTIADSTSFDGVRVSITGQVESNAAASCVAGNIYKVHPESTKNDPNASLWSFRILRKTITL